MKPAGDQVVAGSADGDSRGAQAPTDRAGRQNVSASRLSPGNAKPSAEAVAMALQTWGLARANAKRAVRPGLPLVGGGGERKLPRPVRRIGPRPQRTDGPPHPPLAEAEPPAPLVEVYPAANVSRNWRLQCQRAAACAGILLAVLFVLWNEGATFLARRPVTDPQAERISFAQDLFTAKEWFQQAQEHADEGNFRRALGTIKYALAADPDDAALLKFEGDMNQSLFQFQDARAAYEQALRLDADDQETRQNLVLSRRLGRYKIDPAGHPSTLYGLHRVMLSQKRVSEAIAISRRFPADHALQQATWQAVLEQTGLSGQLKVETDGSMSLDLSGHLQPDLRLIRDFPLTRLNLADTGLEEVQALRGMTLRHLDLARTLVHDLAPLDGMPLQSLSLRGTGVVEISAIAHCPLRELDLSKTRVGDLNALRGMTLQILRLADTPVADLRPLAALPLTDLDLARTRVKDLSPLVNLGLHRLDLDGTKVSDLAPLRSCPLVELRLSSAPVRDLSPLREMPLQILALTGCAEGLDLRPLATCPDLEHLQAPPRPLHLEALAKLPRLRFVNR